MQTYTIIEHLNDWSTWKVKFLKHDLYSTAWFTNAGLIHLWANDPHELTKHTAQVVKFHRLRLLKPATHKLLCNIYEWIISFLNGDPIAPPLCLFSLKNPMIYRKILEIKHGDIVHYSQISSTFSDRMRLIRALKFNPFPPIIPCHRVVPKQGFPGYYTPLGPQFKLKLINAERRKDMLDSKL